MSAYPVAVARAPLDHDHPVDFARAGGDTKRSLCHVHLSERVRCESPVAPCICIAASILGSVQNRSRSAWCRVCEDSGSLASRSQHAAAWSAARLVMSTARGSSRTRPLRRKYPPPRLLFAEQQLGRITNAWPSYSLIVDQAVNLKLPGFEPVTPL